MVVGFGSHNNGKSFSVFRHQPVNIITFFCVNRNVEIALIKIERVILRGNK